MKKIIFTFLLGVVSTLSMQAAFTVKAEPVAIAGSVFTVRNFADGTEFFANRVFVLAGVPTELSGYKFLANNGGNASLEDVAITAIGAGTVYIIVAATETVPSGWTVVSSSLTYNTATPTQMKILSKAMTDGEKMTIPKGSGFVGSTLLAENIEYSNVGTSVKQLGSDEKGFSVKGANNKLIISSILLSDFSVFDIQGKSIYNATFEGERIITIKNKGIYLVKSGNKTIKVIIK